MYESLYHVMERGRMGLTKANKTSFKKGFIPWNKGKHTGIKPWFGKKRLSMTGEKHFMFGKRHSKKTRIKMSLKKKGKIPKCAGWNLGKHCSEEHKRKTSLANGGTGIPQRPNKRYYHLRDKRYFEWRSKVFQRDNWTCQTCRTRGYLEPHHIKGWAKYPELRYEVNNGVTLCLECHKLTRRRKN